MKVDKAAAVRKRMASHRYNLRQMERRRKKERSGEGVAEMYAAGVRMRTMRPPQVARRERERALKKGR